MGGTDLDAVLRNLEVSTIVVVGVSLNIAIPNLVMDAVNAAYRVIVPRDAVAGIPAEYGDAVIDNTLSLLATITTTDELLQTWGRPDDRHRRPETPARADFPKSDRSRRAARAGPVRRRDASPAGSHGLHQPGQRYVGRPRPSRSKAPARCWTATRSQKAEAPAGRVLELPGLGHPLLPPWTVTELRTRRRHHGRALHPIPRRRQQGRARRHDPAVVRLALRDDRLDRGDSPDRTAYLHVDYRNITPIDEPLTAHGRITEIDGRKAFITATMTAADGTLLTEANGLMVRLLPHQP